MKKDIFNWLNEYSLYHKNSTNKIIHWICIPLIIISLFGLLSIANINFQLNNITYKINLYYILVLVATLFYIRLSLSITIGMLIISLLISTIINYFSSHDKTILFYCYSLIFTFSWIAQFIGHKIEGKKPAFVKDLKFLLIGPAWLLSLIYIKFKIKI